MLTADSGEPIIVIRNQQKRIRVWTKRGRERDSKKKRETRT